MIASTYLLQEHLVLVLVLLPPLLLLFLQSAQTSTRLLGSSNGEKRRNKEAIYDNLLRHSSWQLKNIYDQEYHAPPIPDLRL